MARFTFNFNNPAHEFSEPLTYDVDDALAQEVGVAFDALGIVADVS